jgi:AcrR family transcriptional regulator
VKPTRERILDAARAVTVEQGWSGITMARLGEAAGVSRQSVYNEFGTKQQVAEALMAREVGRFLEAVDAQIATGSTPADSVCRAADAVFTMAEANPLVHATLRAAAGSPSPLLPLLTSQSGPVIDAAVRQVSGGLLERFPELAGAPYLREAADAIVRLVISHVVQPGPRPDMRFVAGRLLAPG